MTSTAPWGKRRASASRRAMNTGPQPTPGLAVAPPARSGACPARGSGLGPGGLVPGLHLLQGAALEQENAARAVQGPLDVLGLAVVILQAQGHVRQGQDGFRLQAGPAPALGLQRGHDHALVPAQEAFLGLEPDLGVLDPWGT